MNTPVKILACDNSLKTMGLYALGVRYGHVLHVTAMNGPFWNWNGVTLSKRFCKEIKLTKSNPQTLIK